MYVLSSAVASLRAGVSGSTFAGLDAGLATVARLADEAALAAFDRFQAIWGGELGTRILARAGELGKALEEPPAIESRGTSAESAVRVDEPLPAPPATPDLRLVTESPTALATSDQ
jgi:hypothetical protein